MQLMKTTVDTLTSYNKFPHCILGPTITIAMSSEKSVQIYSSKYLVLPVIQVDTGVHSTFSHAASIAPNTSVCYQHAHVIIFPISSQNLTNVIDLE